MVTLPPSTPMKRPNHRRSRLLASVLVLAFAAGVTPIYAYAQTAPAAKPQPKKKKKKGDPPDAAASASVSASAPVPVAPPPPDPTPASAAPTASAAPDPVVSAAPVASATPADSDAQAGQWKRTAGWIGIGAGAALIGGGFIFYALDKHLNSTAGYHEYAQSIPESGSVCDSASNGHVSDNANSLSPDAVTHLCKKGTTYFIAELASFGVGVVGVGLGVYWLITAPSKPKPQAAWELVPHVGPGQGLDFKIRF